MQSNERIYYLDSMRAILMLLGIVIHSAQIFSPMHVLPVVNEKTSIVMYYIVETFHLFRMPAFFVVSGYFCYMTLEKYGIEKFLKLRLVRIAIPLISTLITLNLGLYLFLKHKDLLDISFFSYIKSGRYIVHLWFLIDLIYLFIIMATFHKIKERLKIGIHINKKLNLSKAIILFILPLTYLFIQSLNKIGFPLYSNYYGLLNPFSILINLTFFSFGYYLFSNKDLIKYITNNNPIYYILILSLSLWLSTIKKDSLLDLAISDYFYSLAQWTSIFICFYFFKNTMGRKSKVLSELSSSSYTVYLFHYILLITAAFYIVRLNLNPFVGFIFLIFTVSILSFLIHNKIIRKTNYLSLPFNGKRISKST